MNLFIILYLFNFLRTLLIILIIYYAIRFVARYVLPMLIDKGVKNMQQKMQDQGQYRNPSRPEGEVTIEYERKNNSSNSDQKGEYVDFEEVE